MNLFDKTIKKKTCQFCDRWLKYKGIYWECSNEQCPVKTKLDLFPDTLILYPRWNALISVEFLYSTKEIKLEEGFNVFEETVIYVCLPAEMFDQEFIFNYKRIIQNIINFS